MKSKSISYILGLIITLCCNDLRAQTPTLLISTNPTTCNGSEGSITFSGLAPNTAYQITYSDDGATTSPVSIVTNGAGELSITSLNAGMYTSFTFDNGSGTIQIFTGVILSNPIFVPTFSTFASICAGDPPPVLPGTSNNGINGTWNPAVVDNQATGTYTFTPAAGTCGIPVTITINVQQPTVPVFSFGTSLVLCGSGTVPVLPNTSLNGITGNWSPAVVDPNNSGTYTFTPTSAGCVTGTTFTVTVNPTIVPVFSFGNSATICAGDAVPSLPNTSDNGVTGTWSPTMVSNTSSGTYTFTPDAGQCALPFTYTVTVNPVVTPTFDFGTSLTICSGGTVPVLPGTSNNGVTGTWNPAVVSNTSSGTYVFTPADPCAPPVTFTVTVGPVITPAFSFGSSATICDGDAVPSLPNTSDNGVTGTWSPTMVSNTSSGTYTFTPDAGQCALPFTYTVTVNPVVTPTFDFGTSLTICSGGTVPALPGTSNNGVTGTWNPAVVSNTSSGMYTFTPAGTCSPPVTFTVTVNAVVTPVFPFGNLQSVCINTTPPVLPGVSDNGITGTWSPATVDDQATGTYTFTPNAGQCANTTTFTYEVNPIPSIMDVKMDTTVYDGDVVPAYSFTVSPAGSINWTNSNPAIGLATAGTGTVPSFTATNLTDGPIRATIAATPFLNGCIGAVQRYRITVLPLVKDVFVPNIFSPNGDGKNDRLFVYSNYIVTVEMHIFNQWGEHMVTLNNKTQGWDGTYKGSPQPVGVYVYALKAIMTDGKTVQMKGTITLVR